MRFIRKLIFFTLIGSLAWWGFYSFNKATDGFSVHQMTSSLPPCPEFEVSLNEPEKASLQAQLNQPFRYIGKGCQFYVFSSADDTIVIKFLKHKHLRPFTWLKSIPMPQKLREKSEAKIERRLERVHNLFSSCKLAYEKMPELTGLLYIHLNRTPALNQQITLIDKMGWKHSINIDDYEYVIQKKAIPAKKVFATLPESEIPAKVDQLAELVLKRCQKGICDRDRSFAQNVAFTQDNGQPLFIDIGQFYEDPIILTEQLQTKEIARRISSLYYDTPRLRESPS